MKHTPTPHVEELCSVLVKTLNGEVAWGERQAYAIEPRNGRRPDAICRMGHDRKSDRSFMLVTHYNNAKLAASYWYWPVLFVIDHREEPLDPWPWIIALVQDGEVPDGSSCYRGLDNKIFNKVIEAIQIASE